MVLILKNLYFPLCVGVSVLAAEAAPAERAVGLQAVGHSLSVAHIRKSGRARVLSERFMKEDGMEPQIFS